MKKLLLILIIIWLIVFSLIIYIRFQKTNHFQTIFFNIGQGDSALIKFDNGETMLIDCGPDKTVLSKLGKYLPFYDRTLDYLVVSHFDLDHYGGCVDVLKRYQVKNIIINGSFKNDNYWRSWDKFRKLEQANEFVVTSSSSWKIGDSQVEFLWPISLQLTALGVPDENDKSIVLRVSNSSTSLLFTGDLPIEVEKVLIGDYCNKIATTNTPSTSSHNKYGIGFIREEANDCDQLNSKILKAGHHGSDTSSSNEWLQAVDPQIAIISVGKNNFSHPSLRVLRRMDRLGINILRTDRMGDIVK